jgi:hypothetical protein
MAEDNRVNQRIVGLLIAVLVATALLAGCSGGSDEPQGDEAAIRQVISDFGKAFNDGKAGDLISLLDAESRKNCRESDIAPLLALIKSFAGNERFTAEASDIKVNGDKATVLVTGAIGTEKQTPEPQTLVKEGGKWKLSLDGTGCDLS